jgi:pantetheine-phosphate adenylyltransferase
MDRDEPEAPRLGLFPGTFDPVTRGHLEIAGRALGLCQKLIIGVADRHHKKTLFCVEERVRLFRESLPAEWLPRVEVEGFTGLLVDFARTRGVHVVVRGLRVISDFEYEMQMALMNKRLWSDLETVFLMPSEEWIYLNSTLVKEVARCGGNTAPFVTPNVARALQERFASLASPPA